MLLIKELLEEVKETSERLAEQGAYFNVRDEEKLDLLLRLLRYMKSYVWVPSKGLRTKVQDFISYGCSYRKTAEKHGVSIKSMHDSMGYADRLLKKRIGTAFELLRSGNLIGAEREFAFGTGSSGSELFLRDIEERFKPVKDSGIDLAACRNEIRFLYLFSKRHLDLVLGYLDHKKIQHLLHILHDSEMSYVTSRGVLFRYLEGELDIDEAMALLADEVASARPTVSVTE